MKFKDKKKYNNEIEVTKSTSQSFNSRNNIFRRSKLLKLSLLLLFFIIPIFLSSNYQTTSIYEENAEFHLSDNEITLLTPENKTYIDPMEGYFPATFGFENDTIGEEPSGWTTLYDGIGGTVKIVNYNEHNHVIELYDNTTDGEAPPDQECVGVINTFSAPTTGTVDSGEL